jgi:eukaryotic-like serine/threonine-protein kinase
VAKGSAEVGSTANRYQILGKLAVGGMAEIFLARGANTTGLVRYCVLKRILHEKATDAQFVQMFLDEAKLAAQLQHPNIASVYDIGMLGESYFFTMEYVHGETVRSLLHRAKQRDRSVPLACALTIIAGAAAGLHHAHERNGNDGRPLGIVHRDISPSNLMISYEGNLKIVDFGVAKAADRVETKSGTVKGKISYLSPEQCRGTRVDRRSDLFSLGIVMWEMLTGARLYRRSSDFENMTAIVHEPPPPPSTRRPDVPRAIDEIVLRLLAKSVADRYQTAGEVVEAIENASMRAGTILSSSAVSRLVHDLFGARPEPWLDLDTETLPFQRMMLASRPLPRNLAPVPLDPVEVELAAVPDLSVSMVLEDDLDDGPAAPEPPPRRAQSSPPVAPPSPAAHPPVLAIAPTASRAPSTMPLSGAAPSAVLTVPGSARAVAAAAAATTEPAAPPSPAMSPRPSQPALPSGGIRALLEAVASGVPASSPSATTLLGHSAPAINAALTSMRQTAAALTSGPTTTVRDAAIPASATTVPDLHPAGASAMTPSGSELPTLVSAPNAPTITPTQRVSPWPSGNAAPPAPFEPPARLAAPSAPNPILDSAPQRSGTRFAAPARPQQATMLGPPATDHRRTPRRASRLTPTLLAILFAAAAAGAGIAWFSMRGDGDAAPPPAPDPTGSAATPPARAASPPSAIAGSGTPPPPPATTGSADPAAEPAPPPGPAPAAPPAGP